MHQEQEIRQHIGTGALWGVCVLALTVILGVGVLTLRSRDLPSQNLQPFGPVPDFALTERRGHEVTRADLLGKVWITDFIFTRCVTECSLVSRRMAQLQDALAQEEDIRLVSITVDPHYDTPTVLTQYAQSLAAHPDRWLFLTGDKAAIYHLVRKGFRVGVVDPSDAVQSSGVVTFGIWQLASHFGRALAPAAALAHDDTAQPEGQAIIHSARFVLVDRQGRIRGYYNSNDPADLQRVPQDVRILLRES